jgi:Na+/H+-dicarboxylate symporter
MNPVTPLRELSVYLLQLVQSKLWLQVLVGMFLGIIVGLIFNPVNNIFSVKLAEVFATWADLPGLIFLRLVQMVMIPLIITSIISGILSNSVDGLKKMGISLLIYFLATTAVAVIIGISLSLVMKPGKQFSGTTLDVEPGVAIRPSEAPSLTNIPDSISKLIPNNPLELMITGEMLGIVIFSILIGIAVLQLNRTKLDIMIKMVNTIQQITIIIISWAMKIVPIAVFGMMAALMARVGISALQSLGYYILVVLIGLFLILLMYFILLMIIPRQNPIGFMKKSKDAILLAFSTASSAAAMPLSMKIARENLNVKDDVSELVIPIGATINMNGTALFQCITAFFIAQLYGVELDFSQMVVVIFTVVAASVGTPAVPGGGVIVMTTILENMGIPSQGLLIIIGIDRILGMFRSAINVSGDLTAAVLFNHWYKKSENTNQSPFDSN